MYKCRSFLSTMLLALSMSQVSFPTTDQTVVQELNQMPLAFTKNAGQWDNRVLFRANAGGATMWFTKEGVTYQFTRRVGGNNTPPVNPLSRGDFSSTSGVGQNRFGFDTPGLDPLDRINRDNDSVETLVITAKFVGANPNPEVIGESMMEYKCNYFLGNDPTKWHTDVPNYEGITLKEIYPGIDLRYSGDGNGQASYEFIAAPGADIAQIKVAYEGAEETSLDSDGRVILTTKWGDMIEAIKTPTNDDLSGTARFSQLSNRTSGFEAGNASRPVLGRLAVGLVYSTYLGGGSDDRGRGIAVDSSGNAYVTGETPSSNFPTQNPYQTYQDSTDVFVSKS